MPPKRRKASPIPFAAVSLLLILLPASFTQKPRLLALAGFNPFQNLGQLSRNLAGMARPSGEAQELQKKVEFLEDDRVKQMNRAALLEAKLAQATGLAPYVKDQEYRLLFADVLVASDSSPWRKSMTLTLGSRAGVRKGMLILYNNQLVGRISETSPWVSRVQLVTDPGFRVGAVATPKTYTAGVSFEKRHIGVYEGTSGEKGQLKWLTGDTPVESGAYVLTTEDPLNGIPAGLILGRVSRLSTARGAFPRVEVEPVLNFRGLETVTLLFRPEEPR